MRVDTTHDARRTTRKKRSQKKQQRTSKTLCEYGQPSPRTQPPPFFMSGQATPVYAYTRQSLFCGCVFVDRWLGVRLGG